MNSIKFDSFIELKNSKGIKIFVLLLEDEYSYLNDHNNWLWHVSCDVYMVRLSLDEFSMLDMGKHPKVLITNNGKEVYTHNGIVLYEQLKKVLGSI